MDFNCEIMQPAWSISIDVKAWRITWCGRRYAEMKVGRFLSYNDDDFGSIVV